ncbi:hypothetical protein OMW55_06905 [Sphingomonas sp. BN140010]|uniref:histidine kinase n=1 Tax=Sphingomonas arvum TaxID=2992113 RepID=A0ABT3JEQ0_9SPHN|nr:histidine kinase dimerization/phospho-acceptor domain-containing protein [Sphingomonas sp. BN140010]MCW3797529.1 hypothetical protein [Sphingomonas sp. BN140010]
MRFDDRLSTVLGLSAEAPRDRAVQWRQLVELVARGGGSSDPALLGRALTRIAELGPEVPTTVRSAAARAIAGPAVPARLIVLFAADLADVAAPLLGSATLGDREWAEVRAAASPSVRELLDTLRPQAEAASPARLPQRSTAPLPQAPAPDHPLFRWECGPTGEIDWVEGIPRGAAIGRSIRTELPRRFEAMQPFADEPLVLAGEGELAGSWRWSGQPRFLPGSGRFAGYSGVAVRERASAPPLPSQPSGVLFPVDHDSLRELIHELRTPLTAIIGFGEIIEGQFLGPAHRAYRDRASEIVRQARLLLAAAEDLDLAAKLRSGRLAAGEGTRIASLAAGLEDRVDIMLRDPGARCGLEAGLAQRLLNRFVEAIAGAAPDQRLKLVVDMIDGQTCLALDRPTGTLGLSEEQLLRPDSPDALGFALRLVRGLAHTVGGTLDVAPERFILCLPAV